MFSLFKKIMPKEERFFDLFEAHAGRRASAVRWNIAQGIVVAWVITLPMSALIAALAYRLAAALFT
jgi:phosphate/sulfate permease